VLKSSNEPSAAMPNVRNGNPIALTCTKAFTLHSKTSLPSLGATTS
jgi:hypothetical protein